MCGIFGFVGRDLPAVEDLARTANLLSHRGPDGGACWHEPGVFLAHRRLSIIDLNTGAQPMFSADGRYVITFNGEIYNYVELREQLRAGGAEFRTASDTEVILAGYARWGVDVAAKLEGMFAFAVYDRHECTTYLARDRFGEKPLLLAQPDGAIAFASELSPLAALRVGGHEIDPQALAPYLCLNYVPGTRTMLRGITRVAAAEWQLHGTNGLQQRARYWSPPASPRPTRHTTTELLDELQARIDGAMRLTLRSDVPVGLLLSGGVDSACVAESAARLGRLQQAFCVDVTANGFSEWNAAEQVARRIGVGITRVPFDAAVLDEFIDVTRHLDDPLADSSAMAVWTVARAARRELKVVLSGDGGDELFGGYLTYVASQWHSRLHPLLPRAAWRMIARASSHVVGVNDRAKVSRSYKLHRFLRAMPLPTREAHFTWNGTWLPEQAATLARPGAARAATAGALQEMAARSTGTTLHDFQIEDVHEYLTNDILAKVDRATMAHGLESRAPLLNSGVAEFALTLPVKLRVNGTRTKFLLRELCARHYGHAHAYAPKQGFSIPVHTWLRHEGRALMASLLAPERVDAIGCLDAGEVSRAVQQHLAGAALGWELWGLMVLVAWFEERVAHPPDLRTLAPLPLIASPSATPVA